jgi:penicillin-binding protein 1A
VTPRRRLLVRRALIASASATTTVALLGALAAWLALNVSWVVPDPGALSGPTQLLARDGTVVARFTAEVDRRPVTLDQVADVAQAAVVAAEDARFREHGGVDPLSLVRAVVTNVRTGAISQGGSTLTQQYVKNAFVGDERTLLRKVREAVIAIQLERDASKDEILERYLNTVYFGEGAYGIEAAARTYFGVTAAELDAGQAAALAQLLPAPSTRNPRVDPEGSERRRDALLERLVVLGWLDRGEADEHRGRPVEVAPRTRPATAAPAFVDHVRRQLEHAYGPEALVAGALTVHTSLDLAAQTELDEAVAARLPADQAGAVEAAAVALDPRTGEILAIHGGRDLRVGDLNLATMARRQNGSAFKPFVYAAALEDGISEPTTSWPSPSSTTILRCVGHEGAPFEVRGGPGGNQRLHDALVTSTNTTFQLVGCELGGERLVEMAARLGVANEIPPTASVALGGSAFGASVLDLAAAYGTLANDGNRCPPRSILEVMGPDGETLELPEEVVTAVDHDRRPLGPTEDELEGWPEGLGELDAGSVDDGTADDGTADGGADAAGPPGCVAATDPDVARTVTAALADAVERGTGTRAGIGRPQAGKTGTTQDLKDAWFVGYTPELSLAVWVGDPGREGPVHTLRGVAGFAEVYGGTIPALVWADSAAAILEGTEPTDFPAPGELPRDEGPAVAPAREVPGVAPPAGTDRREEPEGVDEIAEDEADAPEDPPEAEPDTGPAEPDPPPEEDEDDETCLLIFRC